MTAPSTISDLLALLQRLRAQEDGLVREAEVMLAALRENIAAVQRTLALMGAEEPVILGPTPPTTDAPTLPAMQISGAAPPVTMGQWAQKLRGKTQADALPIIARENGGILRVREVKQIFIATGLAKGQPKYIGPHIYHMLEDMEEFEKEGIGTFRLRQKPYLTAV
jgi:hypothetical protein